jgi:hypothetical protein
MIPRAIPVVFATALSLVACDTGNFVPMTGAAMAPMTGEVSLCLGSSEAVAAVAGELIEFSGELLPSLPEEAPMLDAVWACEFTPDQVVRIQADDGKIWTLGMSWQVDGGSWMDTFLDEGPVEVLFRVGENGRSTGIVVRSQGRLRLVVESGRGGPGLGAEDLPKGLTVGAVEFRWTPEDVVSHGLVAFEAVDDKVLVPPGGDESLVVEDVVMSARQRRPGPTATTPT